MTRNRETPVEGKLWGGVRISAGDLRVGQVAMFHGRAARINSVHTDWEESIRGNVTTLHYQWLDTGEPSFITVASYIKYTALYAPIFAESTLALYREVP